MLSLVQASSTVNRSKPVPFAAPKRASIWGKKIWGRKRHALVDSQGSLLAIKVTGADRSDQEGGRMLLEPLKEQFPRMKLLWGESHYAGNMIIWVKIHLGWIMQSVRALTMRQQWSARARRGRGRVGQALLKRISPASQKMGRGAKLCLDHPLASALPRS